MMNSIAAAAAAIRRGEITPVDLVEQCLARIDLFEDKVRAWVFVDRDGARAEAVRLTKELSDGIDHGFLHGIPVGVKDIFDVFDWPTAAGSKLWANSIARQDSTAVARLRKAGAILLGKTVTTAYASFDPPVTRNPWNLERTPGGSSSGSAAAVACGMCFAALASQTGGSITRPASYCGVSGLKPTFGRVPLDGVVPLAPSMDHVGVIAGCASDLAIVFKSIADAVKYLPPMMPSWTKHMILGGLFAELASPEMSEMIKGIHTAMAKRPNELSMVRADPPAEFTDILANHRAIMAVEAAAYHGQRLNKHPDDYPPRITALIEEGLRCPEAVYRRAKLLRDPVEQTVNEALQEAIFLTPATTSSAPRADTTGDPAFNSPWSYLGLPTLSIPVSWTPDGLPLAIQLVGGRNREVELLATAMLLEKAIAFPRREVSL